MYSPRKAIFFGLLVWLIPFIVAFSIFSIRQSQRALFESIMPVVVALAVVVFGGLYFRHVKTSFLREGVCLGLVWLAISVLIDVPLMVSPPINMPLSEYAADVGLTYLIMPIITIGLGWVIANRVHDR